MSVETPIPGVTYYRQGSAWLAPGRPSLPAGGRDLLVTGTYLPDENTTGVVEPSLLVDVTGNVSYGGAFGAVVIENRRFLAKVSITGAYATFNNCDFQGPASPVGQDPIVACTNAAVVRATFNDCTFRPRAVGSGTNCISGHHFTLNRCRLSGAVDMVGIIPQAGGRADVFINACWMYGQAFFSPDPFQSSNFTHNDLIQWHGGLGLSVLGCRLEAFYDPTLGTGNTPAVIVDGVHQSGNPYYPLLNGTSVLMCTLKVASTSLGELDFRMNWLDGGACGLNFAATPSGWTNVGRVEDNKFGRDYRLGNDFGVLAKSFQVFTLTGNTRWDDATPFNVRKNG